MKSHSLFQGSLKTVLVCLLLVLCQLKVKGSRELLCSKSDVFWDCKLNKWGSFPQKRLRFEELVFNYDIFMWRWNLCIEKLSKSLCLYSSMMLALASLYLLLPVVFKEYWAHHLNYFRISRRCKCHFLCSVWCKRSYFWCHKTLPVSIY